MITLLIKIYLLGGTYSGFLGCVVFIWKEKRSKGTLGEGRKIPWVKLRGRDARDLWVDGKEAKMNREELACWDMWSESHSVISDSLQPHGLYSPWNSPGQNIGVCSLSFLQGIFPTQWLRPGLLHCRWNIYQLSHKGSPCWGISINKVGQVR